MKLSILPALVAAVQTVCAHRANPDEGRGWCGTPEPSSSFLDGAIALSKRGDHHSGHRDNESLIDIPVYFHIVSSEANKDLVTQTQIDDQFATLNRAYKPHDIKFHLVKISYTTDDGLARGPLNDDGFEQYLKESRQGDYGTINVYFYTNYPSAQFGLCTLPEPGLAAAPEDEYFDDGCHINAKTMPGGSITDYNLGYTVVHEIGHWLGLLHTFHGYSCTGSGDLIDDTPQQSEDTSGCPASKDSCPQQPGLDPIHNYMDYSSDPCYQEFTPGQRVRMHDSFHMYRDSASTQ